MIKKIGFGVLFLLVAGMGYSYYKYVNRFETIRLAGEKAKREMEAYHDKAYESHYKKLAADKLKQEEDDKELQRAANRKILSR